jgi:hypothetical protein
VENVKDREREILKEMLDINYVFAFVNNVILRIFFIYFFVKFITFMRAAA